MPDLTPLQDWLLVAIRKEGPLKAGTLKTDARTAKRGGAVGIDENRVFRELDELKRLGLIESTLAGWMPVYPAEQPAKPKQKGFTFA